MLKLKVLNEDHDNFLSALLGMGLAFDKTAGGIDKGLDIFFDKNYHYNNLYYQMLDRAKKMAFKGQGHSKFLRAIHVDLIVQAPIDFWEQAATYTTVDCVQSSSSMHMLKSSGLDKGIDPLADEIILNRYKEMLETETDLVKLKRNLPCWFLYTRTMHMNYMTLQSMYQQRHTHKLPEWKIFCDEILKQVGHPYFITKSIDKNVK